MTPPFIWLLTQNHPLEMLQKAAAQGADWAIAPISLTDEMLAGFSPIGSYNIILGLDAAALQPRRLDEPLRRLALLGRKQCVGGMIQNIAADEVKAGWPFHRLGQLRARGVIELMLAEAPDCAAGEWLVDHSPAQGVAVSYGIGNQLSAYRLLDSAAEVDTAIVARISQDNLMEDARFVLSDPRIAAVVCPLPKTQAELEALFDAAANPIEKSVRERLWEEYQSRVPPPPNPRSAHPPE